MPHPYGTAFTRIDAEPLIKKRKEIADRARPPIVSVLRPLPNVDDLKYYDNRINAFVFSRTELDRLFSGWNEFDALVIFMAAKKDGSDMRPTVVIAACNATENTPGVIDLTIPNSISEPASETPPKFIDLNFPLRDDKDFFTFRATDYK